MTDLKSKDSLTIEIGRLRIQASGRFSVAVATIVAALIVGGRWLGFL